jgi:hypothetical protein
MGEGGRRVVGWTRAQKHWLTAGSLLSALGDIVVLFFSPLVFGIAPVAWCGIAISVAGLLLIFAVPLADLQQRRHRRHAACRWPGDKEGQP